MPILILSLLMAFLSVKRRAKGRSDYPALQRIYLFPALLSAVTVGSPLNAPGHNMIFGLRKQIKWAHVMRTTWTFHSAGQILFGRDAILQVGEIANRLALKRVLIAADIVLDKAGLIER